ncbi:class I SAM-dependent methyltransferase [Nitrogeniibacter aestuarii]|uniref:class I SAM-dependent methyltransferase n=1 Tax=Nitrogeniibacter aestuarii TaxID=2815343 RepID=UPI001E500C58|nr:class I SAM-dependent methyltransferase [Nitrogeniibacter aestuarii]
MHNDGDHAYRIKRKLVEAFEKVVGLRSVPLRHDGRVDHKWHQDFILHMASVVRPERYLEVGIFRCGLFNQMIPFAGKLTGVDIAEEAGASMNRTSKTRFICSKSVDCALELKAKGETFDMIFIDADHSEQAVDADFSHYFELLTPHGIMMLHDTHPIDTAATSQERCGDGYLAIDRLSRQTDAFEMMTIPVHPGLTICRRRTTQLSWQEA